MVSSSRFTILAGTIALLIGVGQSISIPFKPRDTQRPVSVIAHKVLNEPGLDAALDHGANALEMDMTAWKEGWWCDHDGTETSWHDKADDMFGNIAKRRKDGKTILWVWLDIKTPDWCEVDDPDWEVCSLKGLMRIAREKLSPVGVRVLYGFSTNQGKAIQYVKENLATDEAINWDGSPGTGVEVTSNEFTELSQQHKVGSFGDDHLDTNFGGCTEGKGSLKSCAELKYGVQSNFWGAVFGWTITSGQSDYVKKMFGDAKVSGSIYGSAGDIYGDNDVTKAAAKAVLDYIRGDSSVKVATKDDPPAFGT